MVVVQKNGAQLNHRIVNENITTSYEDVGMRCERDAFDTLFDHAPDKLQVVKKVRKKMKIFVFEFLVGYWYLIGYFVVSGDFRQ